MSDDPDDVVPPPPRWPPRSEAAKKRRRELYLARAEDRLASRRAIEEREILRRYDELKAAMKRVGLRIGPVADIARQLDDPIARFEMLKARVLRWDALWSVTLRKRETRGKIIIGGAVLAKLADLAEDALSDQAFLVEIVALLDARVPRVRDRKVVRELLTGASGPEAALPLRPGGPLDEDLEQALEAIGDGLAAFERRTGAGSSDDDFAYDHDDGDEADLRAWTDAEGPDGCEEPGA